MPLLFRVTFPDDLIRKTASVGWGVISNWYIGSSQPIYFDALRDDDVLELVIEPDLSNVFLYVRNFFQLSGEYVCRVLFETNRNRICEDTLVSITGFRSMTCIHIRPKSSPSTNVISSGGPKTLNTVFASGSKFHSLCPASGKFTYSDVVDGHLIVVDFLHVTSDT